MAEEAGQRRKLAAILSADVVGYSRLMQDDEAATVATLQEYRAAIGRVVARHGGRIVNAPGDNMLAEFASAVEAVAAAVEIQRNIEGRNAELAERRRMHLRVGVNLGDVIEEPDGTIYGDGVNIAARMEALAEDGGICISSTVYDAVEGKLDYGFDFLGEQPVKNIARPVRVYRVRGEGAGARPAAPPAPAPARSRRPVIVAAGAAVAVTLIAAGAYWLLRPAPEPTQTAAAPEAAPTAAEDPILALPKGPSIAVLPFTNLSADPEQEYFVDGLTETIITNLSQLGGLLVIARNSAFTYKGRAVDVRQVGRELGVRYVLEGGVQSQDDRVRVSAQLIDASTGGHLWAERYDRDLSDVFALQDDISARVVDALEVALSERDRERLARVETSSIEAYDAYLRGLSYLYSFTREANAQAQIMANKAIGIDPNYARPYTLLSQAQFVDWEFQWSPQEDLLDRAAASAEKAIALDDQLADGHTWFGWTSLWKKRHEQAIAELERAVALDPNSSFAKAFLGEVLNFSGQPSRALVWSNEAIRLDPNYPASFAMVLGHSHYLLGDYDAAIEALRDSISRAPGFLPAHRGLAVVYSELGREQEARAAVRQILRISPQASLEQWRERLPYKDPAVLERFIDGLRKAGLDIPDEAATTR